MSSNILSNNGYSILKKNLILKQLGDLKKDLTVTPKINKDYGDKEESFEVFIENQNNIIVPRYYGTKYYGNPKQQFNIENSQVDFEFTKSLRGTQPEVAAFVLDQIKTKGGGLLQLHTGYGKTTLSLYLASMLKMKTLVIVHKSFLQDQWYERIKQFTNASVGMIRQKKVDTEGKDIVIGMLQSISQIDYDPEIFKGFDLVIADECFPTYTKIVTDEGTFTIYQLYNLWKKNKELPLIKSYNEITKCFEFKKMTYGWEKTTNALVKIKIGKHTIDCTPNHKFLTTTGYKEAQNLTCNDVLIGDTGMCKIIYVLPLEVTISNKNVYDIEVEDNHNFIVTDDLSGSGLVVHNCHHLGSRVFSKALLKICPKYTIGLSATPKRKDGMTKVINWFLGDVLVKVERIGDNAVYIKSFEYKSNDPLFVEKKRWIKGNTKPKPDVVKMTTNLYKIESRNIFITDIINNLRKHDERKTIVLSGRVEHLKTLKKMVDELIKKDILDGIITEDEIKTGFYIGKMKEYELKESEEADIIFATYAMAEEGLDIDGLNTLVFATPKKDIIQSIGRIMRKPIEDGDTNPLVIDIIDDLSCFKGWGSQRNQYYNSKEYTVNSYKAFNDKMIPFKQYMIDEQIINKNEADTVDIQKEYIINKFGEDTYNFEREIEFDSFPLEMFNYNCDFNEIFEINHDYLANPVEHKSEITYGPTIEI